VLQQRPGGLLRPDPRRSVSLRETSNLFMDMIDRPEWVHQKLCEINQAY
jgi:hypothetical protein